MVANAHMLTTENLSKIGTVHMSVAWVKPGRHTYVVKCDTQPPVSDENSTDNPFFNILS